MSFLPRFIRVELGKTSERFESGGRGGGVISTGIGDHGGKSYGIYQFSSNKKVVHKFIKQSKFYDDFSGVDVASDQFDKIWKKVARNNEAEFRLEQHAYTKKTHFDKQFETLVSKNIIKPTKSAAINDLVWSTSVQHGPETRLILNAVKNKKGLSHREIIVLVQDYKYDNVERLFRSSPSLWEGLRARARSEKKMLLSLLESNAVIKE
ncbi:hypothetical protein JCM19235_5011 [Vibrio maritimus]|uniref:Type VI secretion system spike protein VgrG3-like C-terminal domain-containing protein n=1 Tax=Vibrio maritimus TaxID=990268 RepID=A0A090S4X3_9VIBR|nr:hypothetical protein JCM19235_5011 [Vibrio maritimus]